MSRILAYVQFLALWFMRSFNSLHKIKHALAGDTDFKKEYDNIFNNVMEGIIVLDAGGEILRLNQFAQRMFGYEANELVGTGIEFLMPSFYRRQNMLNSLIPDSAAKEAVDEIIGKRKDNSEFFIKIKCQRCRDKNNRSFFLIFVVDTTDQQIVHDEVQKLSNKFENLFIERMHDMECVNQDLLDQIKRLKIGEKELSRTRRLHKALIQCFSDVKIAVIDRQMKCAFVSGADPDIQTKLDRTPGQSENSRCIHPALDRVSEEMLTRAFNGENVSFAEFISEGAYQVTFAPLPDENNEINEILTIIKNVTAQRRVEDAMIRALSKERKLSLMKSNFVAMASHQFRTPLATILSSIFLIENYTGSDSEQKKKVHIDKVKQSVHNLTEILDNLLSTTKIEEGKVQAVNLEANIGEIFDEILIEAEQMKKHEQRISFNYSGDNGVILIDKKLLANILLNLLSNAFKYSSPEGQIQINSSLTNGNLRIQVSDSGIGIPEKEQRNIFKRFYRGENAANIEGTGLGLNIAKKYVRLLKGTIEFSSQLNKGTTFTVNIPVQKRPIEV